MAKERIIYSYTILVSANAGTVIFCRLRQMKRNGKDTWKASAAGYDPAKNLQKTGM